MSKPKVGRSAATHPRKSHRASEGAASHPARKSHDSSNGAAHAEIQAALHASAEPASPAGVPDKIKDLVLLAKEQGYLTYTDINEALPDGAGTPEELDEIYTRLRNLEIEIVDQAEVDRVKAEPEEEDKSRLDIWYDPGRMYLKQMGQC